MLIRYEQNRMLSLTPCPHNQKCKLFNTKTINIKVGSGACMDCEHFEASNNVSQTVTCNFKKESNMSCFTKVKSSFIEGYKIESSEKPYMSFITILFKTKRMYKYEVPTEAVGNFINTTSKGWGYNNIIKKFNGEYLGELKEETYSVGQRFRVRSLVYTLTHVGQGVCRLIRNSQIIFHSTEHEVHNVGKVTEAEMRTICNRVPYTLIEE